MSQQQIHLPLKLKGEFTKKTILLLVISAIALCVAVGTEFSAKNFLSMHANEIVLTPYGFSYYGHSIGHQFYIIYGNHVLNVSSIMLAAFFLLLARIIISPSFEITQTFIIRTPQGFWGPKPEKAVKQDISSFKQLVVRCASVYGGTREVIPGDAVFILVFINKEYGNKKHGPDMKIVFSSIAKKNNIDLSADDFALQLGRLLRLPVVTLNA